MWSHDGKRLAFHSNARDGVSYDIYVVDVRRHAAPRLAIGGQQDTWYPLDWSAGRCKLLLWRYVSINESYLYRRPIAAEGTREGNDKPASEQAQRKGDGKVGIKAAQFAPDGRGVYVVSDEDGEFAQLR